MKQGHTYTKKLSELQKQAIVQEYVSGDSMRVIAARYKVDHSTVASLLRRRGVRSRTYSAANRKHALNESAFDSVSPESAYWVGFVMADGCVTIQPYSNCLTLCVARQDAEHLETFRAFLGSSHPITVVQPRGFADADGPPLSRIVIASHRLVGDLARFGVGPRKSMTAEVRILETDPHFWRGAIDGDGFVFVSGENKLTVGCVGSFAMMTQLRNFFRDASPGCRASVIAMGSIWSIRTSGKHAAAILRKIYPEGCVALPRKRQAAEDGLAFHEEKMAARKRQRTCSVPGCGRPTEAKSYCAMHYKRVRKHGTVTP